MRNIRVKSLAWVAQSQKSSMGSIRSEAQHGEHPNQRSSMEKSGSGAQHGKFRGRSRFPRLVQVWLILRVLL